jgi:ubiquinone/menaquinone biosynthesis C-methylase UbiE
MTVDFYAGAARGWDEGASLVYGPIARELIAFRRHSLRGHVVLDVGAGPGVASKALSEVGATPIAADLSHHMLAWRASERPPAMVADVTALPLRSASVDDVVAAFVLNHLVAPGAALVEMTRVTRSGGGLLACVYSSVSGNTVRDSLDDAARHEGWRPPDWYVELKRSAIPLLASAEKMHAAAEQAGLVEITTDERPVDVGISEPEQLVDYRLGQAHFSGWIEELGPSKATDVRLRLIEQVRPIMQPYQPTVVFLASSVR